MSGWQISGDAPTAYVRFASKLMEPWTDDLIAQARCRQGDRVLDVACGTGFVAGRVNAVSGVTCKVTGIDINEAMLNTARRNAEVEWHLGSATDLPLADSSFDVVLCQQGLQYFPDRAAAAREMHRVLTRGGRLCLNVWGPLDHQPFDVAFVDGVRAFLGADAAAPLELAFSLGSLGELRSLVVNAGFRDVEVRFEHRTARHPSFEEFVAGFVQATPVAGRLAALPDAMRTRFVGYVSERLASYVDDNGMAIPRENHILTATK